MDNFGGRLSIFVAWPSFCAVDRGREEERKGGDIYIVIISIQRLNHLPHQIMDQRKAEADQILRSLKAESIELKDEVQAVPSSVEHINLSV